MFRRSVAVFLALTILFSMVLGVGSNALVASAVSVGSLTSEESQVTALVNGTEAYSLDLELEKIALRHPAFRSAGSMGANETANWLKDQFEAFGLEAWLEPFDFTTWDLASKPSLLIDPDGNETSTSDQVVISSFQSEHLSWPTPSGGAFAQLVTLPLPAAASADEAAMKTLDASVWNGINTTGKIVLTGKELLGSSNFAPRAMSSWRSTFLNKLYVEPPAAVIYSSWYSWNAFIPSFFGSSAGHASLGLHVPSGSVNYEDGLYMRSLLDAGSLFARVVVDSVVGNGTHYNVVGKISGSGNSKTVIVSGHYDTVMTAGFGDNGAGTAGVLELARVFSEAARRGLYSANFTVLFVAFAAEEFWLVGSAHYVKQHKGELANIRAVINLDCIGNDDVAVTQTSTVDGFNLGQTVLTAASDLGIDAVLEPPGGSDHESFLNPEGVETSIRNMWGEFDGISDALPVGSSAMIISSPVLPGDKWTSGTPGWIHTPFDNSTSTQTFGWVKPVKLEEQIKIAALSVMRVQDGAVLGNSVYFPWQVLVVVAVVIVAVVAIVYFVRAKKKPVEEDKSQQI